MVLKTVIDGIYILKEIAVLTRFIVLSPFGVMAALLMGVSIGHEG